MPRVTLTRVAWWCLLSVPLITTKRGQAVQRARTDQSARRTGAYAVWPLPGPSSGCHG